MAKLAKISANVNFAAERMRNNMKQLMNRVRNLNKLMKELTEDHSHEAQGFNKIGRDYNIL